MRAARDFPLPGLRLSEPLSRYPESAVFHGHAYPHRGGPKGVSFLEMWLRHECPAPATPAFIDGYKGRVEIANQRCKHSGHAGRSKSAGTVAG